MPAFKIHHTGTSDRNWDGPANEKNLPSGKDRAFYSRAYGWYDPNGDESVKSTYKFIHHFVDADGTPSEAAVRACIVGIGVMNGGMGGTTIPQADHAGLWAHLAAHLKDAGMTPPELKSLRNVVVPVDALGHEMRSFEYRLEASDVEDGLLRGYAAVFDQLSLPLGALQRYREKILRGAFSQSIANGDDVRALWQHDPNYVLGRVKNKTLTLIEDIHGLRTVIQPPDTQWARDFVASIKRGDVDQMSFGFEVVTDEWSLQEGELVRTIREANLFDVSPVTFPAYPQTSVSTRSIRIASPQPDIGNSLARNALKRRRLELAEKFRAQRSTGGRK